MENNLIDSTKSALENQQSWDFMVRFYEGIISRNEHHYNLIPLLHLVNKIASSERAKKFQAGQNIHTLMISTASYYGLQKDDFHVTVGIEYNEDESTFLAVKYFHSYTDCVEQHKCAEETVLSVLDNILERLWRETKS